MLERNSKLMAKKLIQYLIPSILMIFAMQFGSLIDGILVGNLLGNDALSASSLILPILYIIQLPGFALATGGSIVVANLLGKREIRKAKTTFTLCSIIGLAASIVFAALGFFIAEPLAKLYCPPEYVELGRQYILVYFLTDPIITIALLITSFIAVDNCPRLSSIMYIVANIVKVGSEFLFLKYFNLGMYGAALSTAFGYLICLVLTIVYIKSKRRLLSISFKFEGVKILLKDSFKASSSTALNLLLTAIQMSIVNVFISRLLDPNGADLLIFGVIANMMFVFDLFVGGVIQIIPTICGVLYGEKDYFGLRKIARYILLIDIGISAILVGLLAALPGVYCNLFGFDYTIAKDSTFLCIWIYLISFIPYEISKFNQMYYPTVDRNSPALVTVLCREAILVIPLNLILLHTNGLLGYCIAQTITEVGAVLITYVYILINNKVKKNKGFGLFMIPHSKSIDKYDVTINNDISNVSILSLEIKNYALEHKMSERNAEMIALGAEEMVANIIQYGYRLKNHTYYIDVSLKVLDDKMMLTIKDDGITFDPTQYQEEEQEFLTSGILIVRKIVNNISYVRMLNTNNTFIEIYLGGAS